jgi:catechol 2,3-dioxygenase-like lactoylglutathione lyase family enzyme
MPPVFNQVNLVVADMETTLAFYRRLGFTIDNPPGEWAAHHVELRLSDDMSIEFDSLPTAQIWNEGARPPGGNSVVLNFRVPTRWAVDDLYAHMLDGGYRGQQPPYDAFWGARYAIVEDPDGNGAGLMSPLDPDKRVPWPDPPA